MGKFWWLWERLVCRLLLKTVALLGVTCEGWVHTITVKHYILQETTHFLSATFLLSIFVAPPLSTTGQLERERERERQQTKRRIQRDREVGREGDWLRGRERERETTNAVLSALITLCNIHFMTVMVCIQPSQDTPSNATVFNSKRHTKRSQSHRNLPIIDSG